MTRMKKVLVVVATVALGVGVASSALGLTERQVYSNCLIDNPGLDYECCGAADGSWVEITDEKGNVIDAYCFVTDDEWELSPDTEPSAEQTPDRRVGGSSGTYQQPQPTMSSGTTSGGTTSTSGTYSR